MRRDVVVAARVIELGRLRPDEDVVVGQLAEVEARLGDDEIGRGDRRQILHEEHRQAFVRDLVDRAQREAVAVREHQAFVHP